MILAGYGRHFRCSGMKLSRLVAIALAAVVLVAACAEEKEREKKDDKAIRPETLPGGLGESAADAEGRRSDSGSSPDGSSVPPYLFTLAAAKKINPLVLKLQRASETQRPQHSSQYDQLRDAIETLLNRGMGLPELSPGRNFRVYVERKADPNASALNETIVVHSGILEMMDSDELAAILCHEAAHSTRNHNAAYEQALVERQEYPTQLEEALQEFITKTIDRSRKRYTHDAELYDRVKRVWDEHWGEVSIFSKQQEAEADIVGGQICAAMGFSESDIVASLTGVFEQFRKLFGDGRPKLRQGSYDIGDASVGEFVFTILGIDTHPTYSERIGQIARVREVYRQGNSTIAKDWRRDFRRINTGGASLVGGIMPSRGGVSITSVETGERIHLGHAGACNHHRDRNREIANKIDQLREKFKGVTDRKFPR